MKKKNPDARGVAVASLCQLATTLPGQNASNAPSAGFAPKSLSVEHFLCSIFFSPNKFVFHSHRLAEGGKYIQPDAANFNSWRRHIRLLGDPPDEVVHAWEDVKVRQVPFFLYSPCDQAMFNGGTRKRMLTSSSLDTSSPSSLSSYPPLPSTSPTKQVKLESPDVKQHEVSKRKPSTLLIPDLRPSQV